MPLRKKYSQSALAKELTYKNHLKDVCVKANDGVVKTQTQPFRGVLRKRCSENMQEVYKRTPMSKRDFNKVVFDNFIEIALRHGYSVNLLHIFRAPFHNKTNRKLLLKAR